MSPAASPGGGAAPPAAGASACARWLPPIGSRGDHLLLGALTLLVLARSAASPRPP